MRSGKARPTKFDVMNNQVMQGDLNRNALMQAMDQKKASFVDNIIAKVAMSSAMKAVALLAGAPAAGAIIGGGAQAMAAPVDYMPEAFLRGARGGAIAGLGAGVGGLAGLGGGKLIGKLGPKHLGSIGAKAAPAVGMLGGAALGAGGGLAYDYFGVPP
jgi:hypothetical protein